MSVGTTRPVIGPTENCIHPLVWRYLTPQPYRVAVAVTYIAFAVFFTWPLVLHINSGVTSAIDPVDNIWRIVSAQNALLHHPLSLFTGNTFYPFPDSYLFDGLILGVAIFTLPLALISLPPLVIYNGAVLLCLLLSALAMYALARRFSAPRVAAFIAGMIYAFAPMHLDRIGHVGFLADQWFPLILLFLDRVIAQPRIRDTLVLGACVVMQALCSQYYAINLVVLVPLFLFVMLIRRPITRRCVVWWHLAAAGILALVIIAPVALRYRAVELRYGVERTYGQVTYYSAALTSFFTTDASNRFWGGITAPLRAQGTYTFERNMFPGLLALILAGIGMWVGRRRPWEQFLALLVVATGLLALGPELRLNPGEHQSLLGHLPYDVLYWHLPGFDSMRVPARFGTLMLLGIAGLAATGTTTLLRAVTVASLPRPRLVRVVPAIALVALLTSFGAEYASRPLPLVTLESSDAVPPVYTWLATQPDGPIIALPLLIPDHDREEQIAVREQYFSLWHHHPLINGYANVIPNGYRALVLDMQQFPSDRAVSLLQGLGITEVVVHFDQFNAADRVQMQRRLDRGQSALTVAAQFGDTAVYRVAASPSFSALQAVVPPGASVMLSRKDPLGSGAYMAMLGYVLHGHPLYANLRVDFGQDYRGAPQANGRYDYAILFPEEDPGTVGFANAEIVWQDSVVRVFRHPA